LHPVQGAVSSAQRIVSLGDEAGKVECLSCGKQFHAETQAAVEAVRKVALNGR
jgi:hypothetical protein